MTNISIIERLGDTVDTSVVTVDTLSRRDVRRQLRLARYAETVITEKSPSRLSEIISKGKIALTGTSIISAVGLTYYELGKLFLDHPLKMGATIGAIAIVGVPALMIDEHRQPKVYFPQTSDSVLAAQRALSEASPEPQDTSMELVHWLYPELLRRDSTEPVQL